MKPNQTVDLSARLQELQGQGVETVRVIYPDIHGIARGKDLPLAEFERAVTDGVYFCGAALTDGLAFRLANLPARPAEPTYTDMRLLPLPGTLAQLPWEKQTAWCVAGIDPRDSHSGKCSRNLLERTVAGYQALGLTPVAALEMEFYLVERDALGRLKAADCARSMTYTMGERADPRGVVRGLVRQANQVGLDVIAAHHECGRGQYEVSLNHGEALEAADRGFRFKCLVKEVARAHGVLATFMGKPFADDAGSGLHVHLSVADERVNRFFDRAGDNGVSKLARHFLAGLLAHAPALTAFCSPTVNSYKRMVAGTLVPMAADWGWDNRTAFVRVPAERGDRTRLELRCADAAANPYLVLAASLLAGLDGIKRRLEPPPILDDSSSGGPLPARLEESLQALRSDACLLEAVGAPLVDAFCAAKSAEAERYRRHVSEWETNEYAWHL